jgi:toxin secretion/phage lysis holin
MILLAVLIAYRLDLTAGTTYIRDMVILAFVANEALSIIENAGLMGVPMPAVITKAVDMLHRRKECMGLGVFLSPL